MIRLILGSQSPRRKEVLGYFDLPFEQASPPFEERTVEYQGNPTQYALQIAEGKAASLEPLYPDAALLTADTVVTKEGQVFGKPKDKKHSVEMLQELSGQWHTVMTAMVLSYRGHRYSGVESTHVLFNPLSPETLQRYLQLALHDKAGSYLIQGSGGLIVNRIEGCYYNVVGMPLNTLQNLLLEIGIDLWHYLKV